MSFLDFIGNPPPTSEQVELQRMQDRVGKMWVKKYPWVRGARIVLEYKPLRDMVEFVFFVQLAENPPGYRMDFGGFGSFPYNLRFDWDCPPHKLPEDVTDEWIFGDSERIFFEEFEFMADNYPLPKNDPYSHYGVTRV